MCIHTWPEFGYAAADFFTCGDTVDPWRSFDYLKDFLKAQRYNCMEVKRGCAQLINDKKKVAAGAVQNALMISGGDKCATQVNSETI